MRGGDSIAPEQNQEHKRVRDEKQRNDESRNEVRGLQHAWLEPGSIALIEGVEKIGTAPKVEKGEKVAGQNIRELVTVNGVRVTVGDGTWALSSLSSSCPMILRRRSHCWLLARLV
jgi:hypothetical protein